MISFKRAVRVNGVLRYGSNTSYSVGSIELERNASGKPPLIVILRAHGPNDPGPEDYDFGGVRTLNLFEASDGRGGLRVCVKKR